MQNSKINEKNQTCTLNQEQSDENYNGADVSLDTKAITNNMLATVAESDTNDFLGTQTGSLLQCFNEFINHSSIETHKKQAFLTILTAISAHVGENASIFLSTQPGVNGLSFMSTINRIIPCSLKRELSDISKPLLLSCPQLLKNKVVFAWNAETIKKSIPVLELLSTQGYVNDQIFNKGGGNHNINEISIEGPVASIVHVGQLEAKYLESIPALRLNLENSTEYIMEQLNSRMQKPNPRKEDFLIKIIKKEIERLQDRAVEIPFMTQIVKSLDHTNSDSIIILEKIQSLLRVVTIVKNANFATEKEMQAGYYGIVADELSGKKSNLIEFKGQKKEITDQPLVSTKADYFIVYILILGAFNFNEEQLSTDSIQVFEAIQVINTNFIFNSTCLKQDKATERDIIKTLDNQEECRGWASILHIKEALEKMNGVKSYNSFVTRGVKELLEKKYISRRKDTNAPNKYLYAITTTTSVNSYDLPHPSEIIDPIYNGETIEVFNPLAGAMECI